MATTEIMTQRWEPDSHPGYVFHWEIQYEIIDGERQPGEYIRCYEGYYNNVALDDPEEACQLVWAENRLRNEAFAALQGVAPGWMLKEQLDSDGDPTGEFTWKIKHAPTCEFGRADGLIAVTIPGLLDEDRAAFEAVLPDGVTLA